MEWESDFFFLFDDPESEPGKKFLDPESERKSKFFLKELGARAGAGVVLII